MAKKFIPVMYFLKKNQDITIVLTIPISLQNTWMGKILNGNILMSMKRINWQLISAVFILEEFTVKIIKHQKNERRKRHTAY